MKLHRVFQIDYICGCASINEYHQVLRNVICHFQENS